MNIYMHRYVSSCSISKEPWFSRNIDAVTHEIRVNTHLDLREKGGTEKGPLFTISQKCDNCFAR